MTSPTAATNSSSGPWPWAARGPSGRRTTTWAAWATTSSRVSSSTVVLCNDCLLNTLHLMPVLLYLTKTPLYTLPSNCSLGPWGHCRRASRPASHPGSGGPPGRGRARCQCGQGHPRATHGGADGSATLPGRANHHWRPCEAECGPWRDGVLRLVIQSTACAKPAWPRALPFGPPGLGAQTLPLRLACRLVSDLRNRN
jgi:hypothetical protein